MTKLTVLFMCLLFIVACTNTTSENTDNDTLITENNNSDKNISSDDLPADVTQLCSMEYGPDCPVEKVVECSRDSDVIYKVHYDCTDVGIDVYDPAENKITNCGVLTPKPEAWCENLSEYECSVTDLCSIG